MSQYHRRYVPGGTYFFTVRTARRGSDVLVDHIDLLRHVTRQTQTRFPFQIEDAVVLGDVMHTIWTLPDGDASYSQRWRMIKGLFSRGVTAPPPIAGRQRKPGEKGIWQRRFWEHVIRDADDMAAHRHMIYTAPVQAGLVNRPEHWPYSSVHRALRRGDYAPGASVGAGYAPPRVGCTTGAPYGLAPKGAA